MNRWTAEARLIDHSAKHWQTAPKLHGALERLTPALRVHLLAQADHTLHADLVGPVSQVPDE